MTKINMTPGPFDKKPTTVRYYDGIKHVFSGYVVKANSRDEALDKFYEA